MFIFNLKNYCHSKRIVESENKNTALTALEMKNLTENNDQTIVETLWNSALDSTTDNPLFLWIIGLHIVTFVVYWTVGAVYTILDLTNPKWIEKYKIQPGKNEPVDRKKLKKVIVRVLFNQIVNGSIYSAVLVPVLYFRGNLYKIREVPTVTEFIIHFSICVILREISFYYTHRLLHLPRWYEKYHKTHHEWTTPVAISAQYASDFEHYISNIVPVTIGIGILGLPFFTSLLYLIHVIMRTLNDHSGYHFPYYYNPTRHDLHHEIFNANYGVIGLMDRIYGTNAKPKKIKK